MSQKYRPKLDLPLSRTEVLLDRLVIVGLILLVLIPLFNYGDLPDEIPIHFNAQGEADGWGNKSTILVIPVLGVLLSLVLFFLLKRPHLYNFPKEITPENVEVQYRNARLLLRVVNVFDTFLFLAIMWFIVEGARTGDSQLPMWLLPLVLFATFGLAAYTVYQSYWKE